jgi:REP element-mobilizing transposase RayT
MNRERRWGEAIREVMAERPFEAKAWVLLPNHLHCIWELPEGDTNYSIRWALIKKGFTRSMKGCLETPEPLAYSAKRGHGLEIHVEDGE